MMAILLYAVSFVEHLANHNIAAYFLVVCGGLSFSFGAYYAWDIEHQKLIGERHSQTLYNQASAGLADVLRAQRNDLSARLESQCKELEHLINSNRPEVFVSYSAPAVFEYVASDSWYTDGGFVCPESVLVTNTHGATAYDIGIEPIVTEVFYIFFESLAVLEVGETKKIKATLSPRKLLVPCIDEVGYFAEQENSGFFYVIGLLGKHVEIHTGLKLKVRWRDSGDHHFSSTSKHGAVSAIQREPTPLTEEEMQAAYAEDEASQ